MRLKERKERDLTGWEGPRRPRGTVEQEPASWGPWDPSPNEDILLRAPQWLSSARRSAGRAARSAVLRLLCHAELAGSTSGSFGP